MSRSERLLDLLQALRRHRRPVSAEVLAGQLGVSRRTLYRDIASLRAQGATIDGEAGVGYVLQPGYLLPPLMFPAEEIDALVLGARWVMTRTDHPLGEAARGALARIAAALPAEARAEMEDSALMVGPGRPVAAGPIGTEALRAAIRSGRKLRLGYRDGAGRVTDRVIWPIGLSFFEDTRVLVSWCELRDDYRHFRVDRLASVEILGTRPPRRRSILLRGWRESGHGPKRLTDW